MSTTTSTIATLADELLRFRPRADRATPAAWLKLSQTAETFARFCRTQAREVAGGVAEAVVEQAALPDNLESFAAWVKQEAPSTPRAGWFGDNKVFIGHLWRHMGRPGAPSSTS